MRVGCFNPTLNDVVGICRRSMPKADWKAPRTALEPQNCSGNRVKRMRFEPKRRKARKQILLSRAEPDLGGRASLRYSLTLFPAVACWQCTPHTPLCAKSQLQNCRYLPLTRVSARLLQGTPVCTSAEEFIFRSHQLSISKPTRSCDCAAAICEIPIEQSLQTLTTNPKDPT